MSYSWMTDGGSKQPPSGREIERKFLVPDPAQAPLAGTPSEHLAQGYLSMGVPGENEEGGSGAEVRVRRYGGEDLSVCFLTIKSRGGGLERVEVEMPLTPHQFALLWPLTEGRRVEKTRHRLPWEDGLTFEVDLYHGALVGLSIAEVEFPDRASARRFQPPPWCGREVTEDSAYRNAALATLDGAPG